MYNPDAFILIRNSFKFRIRPDSNVLIIQSTADVIPIAEDPSELVRYLEGYTSEGIIFGFPQHTIDFEKLYHNGVDAILFWLSADPSLYYSMFTWDCDSLLVLNKDIIIPQN